MHEIRPQGGKEFEPQIGPDVQHESISDLLEDFYSFFLDWETTRFSQVRNLKEAHDRQRKIENFIFNFKV